MSLESSPAAPVGVDAAPPAPPPITRSSSSTGHYSSTSMGQSTPISSSRKSELLMEARSARQKWLTKQDPSYDESGSSDGPLLLSKTSLGSEFSTSLEPFLDHLYGPLSTHHINNLTHLTLPSSNPLLSNPLPSESPSYSTLISNLSTPEASDICSSMMNFVEQFREKSEDLLKARASILESKRIAPFKYSDSSPPLNLEAESASKLINQYVTNLLPQITSSPPFSTSKAEELEPLITMFLHRKLYGICEALTSDIQDDDNFAERLSELSFINFEHFDITCLQPPAEEERDSVASTESTGSREPRQDLWDVPLNTLRKISTLKSPIEKIQNILQTSSEITTALTSALPPGDLPGADDFLPAFILCILRSNPSNFKSSLSYIQSYMPHSMQISEEGYVLANVMSGVSFLENLDEGSLSISKEDFRLGVEKRRLEISARIQKSKEKERSIMIEKLAVSAPPLRSPPSFPEITAREVRSARLSNTLPSRSNSYIPSSPPPPPPFPVKKRYSYISHTADTLGINDVEGLLREYKELVYTCERLVKEREEEMRRRDRKEREDKRRQMEGELEGYDNE